MWEKLCEQIFPHCMLSSPVRGTAHGRFLKQMQTRERSTLTPPLFSDGGLSPVLLWWRSKGSGVLSICFSWCQGVCTQQAACHTGRKLPRCPHHPEPPASFSTPCPAPITTPLSRSATWVMTTPGTLSPRCHFCHRISCWLRPCIPCLLFSAHVLTVNCLENRKGIEAAVKKKKIDQGPGKLKKKQQKKTKTEDVSKCFLCNNFYPSHTFLLKATLLSTQKWVFLFGNNSRRASEATVKLLQSRCFFLSPINLTPTPPLSSFMLALAHQF